MYTFHSIPDKVNFCKKNTYFVPLLGVSVLDKNCISLLLLIPEIIVAPALGLILYLYREKMFTLSHIAVLECVTELVACLAAVQVTNLINI